DHSYFPDDILRRCPGLKHIVFLGTGAASYIDLAAAERLGVGVSTIKGYGDLAVAEHSVALLMAAARDVATIDREVARIAGGLGMEVIAWNRTRRDEPGVGFVALDDLLARSDIVSLHLL